MAKYKNRKTGEIVDVIAFDSSKKRYKTDYVSFIDSNGVEHVEEKGLNLYWDFEPVVEYITNWETLRAEYSLKMMQSLVMANCDNEFTIEDIANNAVVIVDALIERLKK